MQATTAVRRHHDRITPEQVWEEIARASFAVIGYSTPDGKPRSSGVIYRMVGHRLYVVTAPSGWKARHIAASGQVSVTVPVRRGGLLSLLFPIPPATISFHGTALVHPPDSVDIASLSPELLSMVPPKRAKSSTVIEIVPDGEFLTYGIGVSLTAMRSPSTARAWVPVHPWN
jgi:hypothetical protein